MALQPLFWRVFWLVAFLVVLLVAIVLGLVALGVIGLTMIAATPLSFGVAIVVGLLVGLGLFVGFALGLLGGGLIALTLFALVLLLLGSPTLAIFVAIVFLILATLLTAIVNPLTVSFFLLLGALIGLPLLLLALGVMGPGAALVTISGLGLAATLILILWLILGMHRLPLPLLGLGALTNLPAVPFRVFPDLVQEVMALLDKQSQQEQAKNGLSHVFTLAAGTPRERTASARLFLLGTGETDAYSLHSPEQFYSLDQPEQFAMGWTTTADFDRRCAPLLPLWSNSLRPVNAPGTSVTVAATLFWPHIAKYTTAFGIVPLQKVDQPLAATLEADIGPRWTPAFDAMVAGGRLYVIDTTIFGGMAPPSVAAPRFTPATLTFLAKDPPGTGTGAVTSFTPFLIRVSNGQTTHFYADDPADAVARSTWLYAIQAAKTSIMVWGIWLGHVYRLHFVTSAMFMTMAQRLSLTHPLQRVIGRQSRHVIGFDLVLMLDWSFPPPTSCNTSIQLLQLLDMFARGRAFFDDEPQTALDGQGLLKDDFSSSLLTASEINLPALVARLTAQSDPPSIFLASAAAGPTRLPSAFPRLAAPGAGEDDVLRAALMTDLNALIDPRLASPPSVLPATPVLPPLALAGVTLSQETSTLVAQYPTLSDFDKVRCNRLLLQDAFPAEIVKMDWNLYPVARYMLRLFEVSKKYVDGIVDALYLDDAAVTVDADLQNWMIASANSLEGNVAGVPVVDSKVRLKRVLTSLIYRITAHGVARLSPVGHPGLTFMANFPPCLEDSRVPDPFDPNGDAPGATPLSTTQLLAYLPKTGTIGQMIAFIYGFVFSNPIETLLPRPSADLSGLNTELHPFGLLPPACDTALQTFRSDILSFIKFFLADSNDQNLPLAHMNFKPTPTEIYQWELSIET